MSWAAIRGHEQLVEAFRAVVRRGRLAHAYLFVGPEGIGKRRFAVELAKTLLCEAPGAAERFEACDTCPACVQVTSVTHPDFQLVGRPEGKHDFPIDTVKEVIKGLAYKPARGRHRIALLDDADDLNEAAANCFLKTLEEPPPQSLLILLGMSADRQLPTIRSRCQVVQFLPLAEDVVADLLTAEGALAPAEEGRQLARLAGGSLGRARLLADPAVRAFRRGLLDAVSQPRLDTVALAGSLLEFAEGAKDSAEGRIRTSLAIAFLVEFLRAVVHRQQGDHLPLPDPADAASVERLAGRADPERVMALVDRCLEADYQNDRNVQQKLVLEALADALAGLGAA